MQVETLPPFAVPYAGLATNVDRDLHSHDRNSACRLARRIGTCLLIVGCAYLGLWLYLRRLKQGSDPLITALVVGAALLAFLLPGVVLKISGTVAHSGRTAAPLAIFFAGLWTLIAVAATIGITWIVLPFPGHRFEGLSGMEYFLFACLVLSLINVFILIGLVRVIYHSVLLLTFRGRRFSLGGAVRIIDFLLMSKRRMLPENALGGAALLGKLRLAEGLLLLLVGMVCFVNSVEWVKPAQAPPPDLARNHFRFTGDIYGRDAGLPAAERKVVLDVLCEKGMPPDSREFLDEALRWEGQIIIPTLVKPITATAVGALVPMPAIPADRHPTGRQITITGFGDLLYLPDYNGPKFFVIVQDKVQSSYPATDSGLVLRKLNADLDAANRIKPGTVTQEQAAALTDRLMQHDFTPDPAMLDSRMFDRFELFPDGTLKVWQGTTWQRVHFDGNIDSNTPEQQSTARLAALQEAREAGKIRVPRWSAALLAAAGLLAFLTGLTTTLRSHWGRPGNRPLSPAVFVLGTIFMSAAIFCVLWKSGFRLDANYTLFTSVELLPAFLRAWPLWTIPMGIVGPLRIGSLLRHGDKMKPAKPVLPLC